MHFQCPSTINEKVKLLFSYQISLLLIGAFMCLYGRFPSSLIDYFYLSCVCFAIMFFFFHWDYVIPILCPSVARQKGLVKPWLVFSRDENESS